MKTKFWMIAVALLALMLCGTAMLSSAQEPAAAATATTGSGWQGHRHGRMGYLARELNLTDAQKQQVKTILQDNRQNTLPVMQQLAANRKAMLAATANGQYDQAKVQALATQQAQLMAQMLVQKQAIQHQIYTQVLTADQRSQAEELRAKQIARIDNRMQKFSQFGATAPQQ
jgi:Spy/CpxP family protein refolding chaperone